MRETDVLVIGAGLAGLWAAIEAHDAGARVIVVSKTHPLRSHSTAAQGGIAIAIDDAADVALHAADTLASGAGLADPVMVDLVTAAGPALLAAYERFGCRFDRDPDGKVARRPFGGHRAPRAAYAADRTGRALVLVLYEQILRRGIEVLEDAVTLELATSDDGVSGAVVFDLRSGGLVEIAAGAVVLATGGHAAAFSVHSNGLTNTGDGLALALSACAALADLELLQFHPTGLAGHGVLLSEACRGEGGVLRNSEGERFMPRYDARGELAPRDVVTRAEQAEIDEGRGVGPDGRAVWLDLTGLDRAIIERRLPQARELVLSLRGIDVAREPVAVAPTAHYAMGGVASDAEGRALDAARAPVVGLYAAGECAATGVHGANRLGANSLLEASVMGRRAGTCAAEEHAARSGERERAVGRARARAEARVEAALAPGSTTSRTAYEVRAELGRLLSLHAGVLRDGEGLRALDAALERLETEPVRVRDSSRVMNTELCARLEIDGLLVAARATALSALLRQESRGAHQRRDFPDRDDARFSVRHFVERDAAGALRVVAHPLGGAARAEPAP